ncbi:PRC-barrel domain-containing protein [Salinarimonas sp. NSM]|uniref:PRC-barrel domain-containing protein n=1 Tax=Salinarimonas sp. NSM TaxID=3458003 RepID=UPI00403725AA
MTHHRISKTAPLAGALAALLLAAPAGAQGDLGNPPDRPPPREQGFEERGGSSDALRQLGDDYRLPPRANESRGPLTIVDFEGAPLRAPSGDIIGTVDKIVLGPDRERWVVFDHGGFLGLDERKVALPLARVTQRGDDFYVRGVTEEDIRNLPGVVQRWADYPRLEVQGPLGLDTDETEAGG